MTENPIKQPPPPWAAGTENRQHELNPELSEENIDIVRRYGEEREIPDGTLLWNVGDRKRGFFLVLEGELEVFRRTESGEHVVITYGRRHYGGEIAAMSGRGALLAGRAKGRARAGREHGKAAGIDRHRGDLGRNHPAEFHIAPHVDDRRAVGGRHIGGLELGT